ncbi:multiple PDZ domain protein-like isoform X1 [Mytilus trossulus]|uniref:multiple PDZ domain protein-like isoform X1 n=2 Tax=Mytilus trossulus TaxID=6551 RepID=UPI00300645BF
MSLVTDTDQASGFLDHLQNKLREQGDYTKDDDITSILSMLESPLFKQLLTLQESLHELKQVTKTYPVTENAFEISNSGELILNVPPDGITNPSFNDTTADHDTYAVSEGPIAMPSYDVEFQRAVERSAQGREVETIKLFKPENSSLGFSVVGMKKKDNAESGIFIQDIQPGGIAARDGRLREQDQILAIDGQPLDLSHHEAIRILQSAQGLVQLVVARGQYPNQQGDPPPSPHKQQLSNVQSEGSADMVLNTEWTQIEVIDLINDGTGLGFGIIGGRSTGVVVKTILPGGIADINGRLHSGDHLLQIGDVNVRGMTSEQVAQVLRQSGSQVRLIVARPINEPPTMQIPHAPIVPTHQLDEHLHQINTLLDTTETIPDMADPHQQQQQFNQGMGMDGIVQVHHHGFEDMSPEYPEINYFDVELLKDNQNGLGITIAGYVGRQSDNPDDLCGIFVKSVAEGSAAGVDGRIQVNDQIIQVDNQSLQGFTNHQAVEVLRNTGQMVLLKLARYQRGPKFEKLQQYLAHPNINIPYPSNGIGPAPETAPPGYESQQQVDVEDIPVMFCDEDYTGELLPDVEAAIRQCWEPIIGEDFEVVVSQLSKFREGGGLGISLEGTVDVENGVEVRPHHYIRSILHDGPVGINGRLKSGDELLEVNGKRLLGLNHKEVVGILKELPQHVRLVCARRVQQPNNEIYAQQDGQFFSSELNPGVNEMGFATERLVKAKSEMALASAVENSTVQNSLNKMKSRSLEPLSNFAMWSSEPVVIELKKGDKGLGFSILDYQDPVNPGETVIVIKSLVPHGVAQQDGRLVPGDRLMFVNENNLENATLDEAVQALKGAPQGTVRIGVAKPLPFPSGFPGQNQNATLPFTHAANYDVGYGFPNAPFPAKHAGYPAENVQRQIIGDENSYTYASVKRTESTSTSGKEDKSNRDSFYESSEDEKQVKLKPVVSPRTNIPPKNKYINYENEQIIAEINSTHVHAEKPAHLPPKPHPRTYISDYLNTSPEVTEPKETGPKPTAEASPRAQSPIDYENTSPVLPSYEEAISGDLEFGMDDAAAPPVPPREESNLINEIMVANTFEQVEEKIIESEISSDEQSVKSPSKESPLMRSPPPIPPKPVSPRIRQLKTKEAPPPLPVSSPPPLDNNMVNNSIGSPDQADAAGSIPIPHSSPQPITSDLKQASPSSSLSPGRSPISSPSLMRTLSGGADSLPVSLEKQIKIKKGNDQLGLTVESTDKGINGCHVKSIATNSAVGKDGRIKVGDYIVNFNNESTRKITNAQVRAIIRRASLLGFDISITYISSEDAAAYKSSRVDDTSPPPPTMMPSPNANLSPLAQPKNEINSPVKIEAAEKLKTAEVTRLGQQTWGPPRTIELYRQPDKSLGISIVGGRVDMFHVQPDHVISGIFIKQVLEDSPAGKNGTLKTGDRILEVDGIDLRNASHDQAVDAIRNSGSPVKFVVQSLCDAACPNDLETEIKPVQSYDEIQAATNAPLTQTSTKPDIPQKPILNKPELVEKQIVNKLEIIQNQVDDDEEVEEIEEDDEEDNETEDEYGYTHKRVLRRYGDLGGEVHLVDLTRGGNGLGISLAGNKDRNTMSVFVAGIQPESVAAKDGRIEIGDELLEVNGQVLYGRSHLNASAIIKMVSTNVVKIVLVRREDNLDQMAVKPLRSYPPGSTEDISTSPSPPKKPVTSPENIPSSLDVVQVVSLIKGVSGLGFAIVEDMRDNRQGIYIRSITQGGVAAKDAQLSVGDQILEVGDKELYEVHYDKAIEILRNSQGKVKLKVRKCGVDTINYSGNSSQPPPVFQLDSITGESSTDPMEEKTPQPETNDPKTCAIIPGRETYIEIEKGRTGLGLSIVGGNDTLLGAIIVHEVYEDGAASRDGRLWAGDQVLEVNNEELREASHDYAIQVLRQTPATVGILVFRDDNQVKEEDIYDIFTVDLNKKQGRGLGLSIVGKRNDVGVYISDIVKGGVSESDGRLMQGDQILAVNGEDMRNATQEYAAAVLKTSLGKVTLTVGRLKAGSRASSRKQSNPGGLKKSESTASNKSKGGRHSKTVSEDLNHVRIVELTHDVSGSLGLSIAGGIGSSLGDTAVLIANLTPGGAAARSQKLKIGDKIIQINDRETDGMSHDDAVQLLKSGGTVTLMVTQGEETRVSVTGGKASRPVSADMTPQDNAVFDDDGAPPQCKTITLNRGPAGLGFSIVGGHGSPHGDLPIYVKSVFAQGAASVEGNLKRGDQILSVNGQSLEGCTHEEAVNILKNAKGNVTLMVLSS